ncbi:hypothetical protein Taro_002291 [Colocasia esculenta]|uniref:Uncharacterized protein n=1 Tax=Colocasia esculenta TaxID=4460 RepID=A0A843TDR0_COLES|nr:hypothetical protein [Colocasia esculenta]
MAHQEHEKQEVEQAIDPGWAHGEKTEKLLTTQQQQQLQDEISGRQIRRDYTLLINVDDDDDPDPEFTAAARASRSYAEEDDKRRGLGTSAPHLSRDDSRRSLPRRIKQALKGVKATAKAAKEVIKGIVKWFLHAGVPAHTAESPYFHSMLDAIAEARPGLKCNASKILKVLRKYE